MIDVNSGFDQDCWKHQGFHSLHDTGMVADNENTRSFRSLHSQTSAEMERVPMGTGLMGTSI